LKKMKRVLSYIPVWLKNKYAIAVAVFLFAVLFMDKNDLFTQMSRKKELGRLKESKEHYTKEIKKLKEIKEGLEKDPRTIEKYAREKHLMTKENEDIFLIQEEAPGN